MDDWDGLDPRDVEAHMERAPEPAGETQAAPRDPGHADRTALDQPMTPLGAESLAAPEVPPLSDPGDASLLALIDRLASLLDRTDLTELEVQVGETGLVLRKPQALAPTVVAAASPSAGPAAVPGSTGAIAAPAPAAEPALTNGAAPAEAGPPARPSVKAPLTGIWYGAPAPGSAPYVSQGGEVNTGQVIGLIEAMKLFNEIKSDLAGRVVKVHAEDGKLVKAKQPLIEVEPL
ncbi:MAG TPA: biotin/lipoyl-containing protein [Candidatus Limnocylindrales bacterium]|nr:biotin/lipoyl-containing protein [Candidatus Limnocylindrales bacterium]